MVDEKTISLNYIKKKEYPGSDRGVRFMLSCAEKEGEKVLLCRVWPEPLCLVKTDPSLVSEKEFSFSQEGKCEAVDWINTFERTS